MIVSSSWGVAQAPRTLNRKVQYAGVSFHPERKPTMFSAQVLDHFQNPRNVGDLDYASASAQVENPACGDVMRLSIRVEDGMVVAAAFRAQGCVPSIACGSRLAEALPGMSLAQARGFKREQLVQDLGGLPEASSHAGFLAIDALRAVLSKLEKK